MRKAIALACMNPWHEGYGRSQPTGIISAPTHKILMQSTMAQFDKHCPRELILRRRGPPWNDIIMANGFKWLLHSGEGELEGNTSAVVVIDEIHHRSYASNPRLYFNMLARIRDKNATRLAMLVAGLPEAGWCRETFDRSGPDRITVLCGTRQNPHIPKATINAFMNDCPSGEQQSLIGGQWRTMDDAVYSQFDTRLHITDAKGDPNAVTFVALDVGNRGALVFGQQVPVEVRTVDGAVKREQGLLIVDQILTRDISVEEMCLRIKSSPWRIVPGTSKICTDPTTRLDEMTALRRHFPGVQIVKRDRGDDLYPIESGVRLVQRALKDAVGNTRLKFTRSLVGTQHGIIDSIQRYRRTEKTQDVVKDNSRDHVADALRYLVCELLPAERPQARFFTMR